mgnify:CR=1 FL=1
MSESKLTRMRFSDLETPHFAPITGIQALLRASMSQAQRDRRAGLNTAGFISGYQGSPLGGVDIQATRIKDILREAGVIHLPGLNEIHAANAVWGTQQVPHIKNARYDGIFAMWYGKGPGFDLASDAINHANDAGVSPKGGIVWVVGDDHEAKSSTRRYQTEWLFRHLDMPFLAPNSVQEIHDYMLFGWALSRFCGAGVGIKVTSDICDASASILIDSLAEIAIPELKNIPHLHLDPADKPIDTEKKRMDRLAYACMFANANHLNIFAHEAKDIRFVIVAVGRSYVEVMEALTLLGVDERLRQKLGIAVVKIGMPWPLSANSPTMIRLRGASRILVVEDKANFVQDQLKAILYDQSHGPEILGKELLSSTGTLTATEIAKTIVQVCTMGQKRCEAPTKKWSAFEAMESEARAPPIPALERISYFCSGCPHNASTKVPEGARAYTGIGCHYMVGWMNRNSGDVSQMGGEGVPLLGSSPFTDEQHAFVNMGDGTYDHSGSVAIDALIAGMKKLCTGKGVTVKILFNGVVAMTGGQKTQGGFTVPQITRQLAAKGVETIVVIAEDPRKYGWLRAGFAKGVRVYPKSKEMRIMEDLQKVKGVSILIHDQVCAAHKRREIKRGTMPEPPARVLINPRVCEGCGNCLEKSNCLSVQPLKTWFGTKLQIDQSSCNTSFDCVQGFCPSFVRVTGAKLASRPDIVQRIVNISLDDPALPVLTRVYNIRFVGIGGTGVSTMEGIFVVAAHLDGRNTYGYSGTGLSQKAGPVISDVRIAPCDVPIYSTHIPPGEIDLFIACDLVTATHSASLASLNRGHSQVVVNLHETPTAEFILNPHKVFPKEQMLSALKEAVGADHVYGIDATSYATELFGDSIATNMMLAGYAYQMGLIPLSLKAIIEAIEHGVDVEMNKQAFACGRYAAAFPHEFENLGWKWKKARDAETMMSTLNDLVSQFAAELEAYQNKAYADRYRDLIERVSKIDIRSIAMTIGPLEEAVIRNLFKLMAPKNEMEVARLYTNGEFRRQLDDAFEPGYKIAGVWLAPPFMGTKKRLFGSWIFPILRVLAKLKFLRGTWMDPFGYHPHRKEERALVQWYIDLLLVEFAGGINEANYDLALTIAKIPEEIRGYGHIQEASVAKAKVKANALLKRFREKVTAVA